jgi:kynurenine formamidase
MKTLYVGCAFALWLAVAAAPAFAQGDAACKNIVPPSPFGPADQTGATNRVTPGVVKAAAAEIQTGTVVQLTHILKDGVPLFGTRFTKAVLTAYSLAPGASFGENQLTFMEDTWLSQSHVGTHLDALGHIGRRDCYYNQTQMGKFITQNYITKLGMEHLKSFATRGVFLDMVRYFESEGKLKANPDCGRPCLDKGTRITAADLQGALKMANTTLREADIVILNTGWGHLFLQFPKQNALYNSGEPGITKDAATWLAEQKIVAVGADTWAVEVIPGEDPKEAFIIHNILITDSGIHIIENVRTDLMAEQVAKTGRATFFFEMVPPLAYGLTGNFVGINAIQ